ncbi:MAG: YbaB/EbfC family nucleoid-associated protein [Myxococcota bacterium]
MSDGDNPFEGGGGLQGLLQQATQMQAQVQEAQSRAAARKVVGEAGGGLVKVTANGKLEVLQVEIDPAVADEDREMLQDLVVAATNDALSRAKNLMNEELGPLAQMLQSSGLGGLGGI